MSIRMPDGNWPTMVTLFNEDKSIDYRAMSKLINWYIEQGADGLFAICQSSEMFYMSLKERAKLAAFVVKEASGRVPVIASGHISEAPSEQIEEIKIIADTGIEAFVMISNRLALVNEGDDILMQRVEHILEQVPDVSFGMYECPLPYKRLVTPTLLRWLANTGRFYFLKDTCCDADEIARRQKAVEGTLLKLYNANTATLLESYRLGLAGYSGIMANFHLDLYAWLFRNWKEEPEKAEQLQAFLTVASFIERQEYPLNAKYNLQLEGIADSIQARVRNSIALSELNRLEVRQLNGYSKSLHNEFVR